MVKRYDAGLLSDYGGGNVEWWQDYLRAEIERCNDHYEAEIAAQEAELASLQKTAEGISHQCTILNGKLSLYRKAVGPVIALLKDGFDPGSMLVAEKLQDCIRILGEAGNERI